MGGLAQSTERYIAADMNGRSDNERSLYDLRRGYSVYEDGHRGGS